MHQARLCALEIGFITIYGPSRIHGTSKTMSPSLVFIPGLMSDARVWASVAGHLPARFAARHAPPSRSARTITDMAEEVLAGRDGPVIACGHSMGGRIAMEMARLAPSRVRGLVLANTGHHPRRAGEAAKREAMIALGQRSMEALADAWLPPMLGAQARSDTALTGSLREMVLEAGAERHEREMRALLDRPDAGAGLPDILAPVLLLAADEDGWSPPDQHREIAGLLPDAALKVISGAGHFLPAERPGAAADALAAWLDARFPHAL